MNCGAIDRALLDLWIAARRRAGVINLADGDVRVPRTSNLKKITRIKIFLYLCSRSMTMYNPHMTLHKLFLNVKKRDIYFC